MPTDNDPHASAASSRSSHGSEPESGEASEKEAHATADAEKAGLAGVESVAAPEANSEASDRTLRSVLTTEGVDALPPVYHRADFVSYDDAKHLSIASSAAYRSGGYMCEKQPKPLSKCLGPSAPIRR